MKDSHYLRRSIFIVAMIVVIAVVIFAAVRVNARNRFAGNIAERLKGAGAQVKYVRTISRLPYEIEIALQSTGEDAHLAIEDNWNMQIARREATLAYRTGLRIESFQLTVFNTQDQVIHSEQKFLYPSDLSQQLTPPGKSRVDDEKTKALVKEQLQLGQLSLEMLDVISDEGIAGSNGQILLIEVSAPGLAVANQSLLPFLGSVFKMLDTINVEQGTSIVLCQLRLVDQQGDVLLDYVKDVEIGYVQWTSASELTTDWYPHPKTGSGPKEITPTPAPVEVYPAQPTSSAYP